MNAMPVVYEGEVMVHDDSHTMGIVVATICPPDKKLEHFKQKLQLRDGSQKEFPFIELRLANPVERHAFAA